MAELAKKEGVNSFKVFMGYKETLMLPTVDILEAFEAIKEVGGVAAVHAENGDAIKQNEKRLLGRGMTGPEAHLMARPEEVSSSNAHFVVHSC